MGIKELIEGNNRFVAETFAQEKNKFDNLLKGQHPHSLVVTCSDSRTPPEMFFGCGPGEIFVHRNIGNMVVPGDWNFATVLEYAVCHLHVKTVVVCGHEKCGAIKALAGEGGSDSFIPGWLAHAKPALERLNARMKKPSSEPEINEWLKELEKENIRLQLENLMTYPMVVSGISKKNLEICGMYWDMTSGKIVLVE
ncbi:MAG: carbonic anhydrase [Methanomicrobiales archaeon]|nr:carbonic anhydrase [Methanomicrobiales archaeon]